MFQCFDFYVKLSFAFIIKNHIMKRFEEIEKNLFKNLLDKVKLSLTLNCWSAFNRQFYLFIIAFFINKDWNYREILIDFEYMKEKHTSENLTKVVEKILIKHNIQTHILTIITDNAFNNVTFFLELVKNLFTITSCVNVISNNDENEKENDQKKKNIVHVSCLTHVLQLALQVFLNFVRVNSINDELQKNWNDQDDIKAINQTNKKLSMTLTKIITYFSIFLLIFLLIAVVIRRKLIYWYFY
jgi:hypothetical protein